MSIHWGGRGPGHLSRSAGAAGRFAFYVDSINGSDGNDGRTPDTAFQTFAAVTQAPNIRIGIARGSVFRETITISEPGVRVGAYGTGNRPAFIGSTLVATTWTNTSGNVWSTALASSPTNLYLVSSYAHDGITKLTKNTSTPTAPGSGEWGHSSSTLYVNSATDPNTLHYERVTASTTDGVYMNAADITIEGIGSFMHTRDGFAFGDDRITTLDCDSSFNANDNFNGVVAKDALVERCFAWGAGTSAAKGNTGADGDGVSFHGNVGSDYSSVTVRYCDIRYNRKSGIGNQSACIVTTYGNILIDNYWNLGHFGTTYTGEVPMLQRHSYNILKRSSADGHAVGMGSLSHALEIIIENCTIYSAATTANQAGIFTTASASGGANLTMAIRNTIVSGFARGIDSRDTAATLTIENCCVSGNTTNYFDNSTRTPALSTIPVNSTTSSPSFTDAANGDFTLQSGSPCINAGQDLGYTSDQARNPITGLPDIGALERVA